MKSIVIHGPLGSFEVCALTGHILTPYTLIPREYNQYSSAMVDELRTWCESVEVELPKDVPLLCVSMRRFDGQTEQCLDVLRDEWASMLIDAEQGLAA